MCGAGVLGSSICCCCFLPCFSLLFWMQENATWCAMEIMAEVAFFYLDLLLSIRDLDDFRP